MSKTKIGYVIYYCSGCQREFQRESIWILFHQGKTNGQYTFCSLGCFQQWVKKLH